MAMRIKQVVISITAGASESTASSKPISIVEDNPSGLVHFSGLPTKGRLRSVVARGAVCSVAAGVLGSGRS